VYWNTTTGLLQLDPKGWDLNAVIISYSPTTASILSTTPGPFSYATGTGANALSGATGLANQKTFPAASSAGDLPPTTYPARIGITGNLPGTQFGTVFTNTGDVGNIASTGTGGYWNQPWAFPSDLISSASSATMTMSDWRTYDLASNANANILGYGSQQAVFQYGINGVVGNQMGAVIPVSGSPDPTTLTWYGDGSTAGGSGTWTTTGNTWFDGSSVRSWVPGATAIFSGSSGGTVTLGEAVSANNGLQFTTSGYTLSGAALTLGGSSSNSVQVGTGATATISAPISGSTGLVKTGAGTLALGGNNNFTGATSVQTGTLQVSSNNALATSAVTVPAGSGLKVDSGLTMKSPSVTISGGALSASGVTLLVNGTSGIAQLVFSASSSVTGSPSLSVSGSGVVSLPAVGRQTVAVTALSVDQTTGGKIDIGQGRIDVAVGGISEADLRADLIAGRSGGTFSGTTGIMTTGGKASPSSANPAVGYRVLGSGAAIVAWAAYGDSNLDGQVNSVDVSLINNSGKFGAGGTNAVWSQGDFNYSGNVNSVDTSLLNNAALFGAGSYLKPFPASSSGLMAMVIGGEQDGVVFALDSLDGFTGFDGSPLGAAAVPEPATWVFALLGAAGVGILRRRKATCDEALKIVSARSSLLSSLF
jgi:autotransporter-associated beta strand protein